MSAIKCCYYCSDRRTGCHATCEKYQHELQEYKRRKEYEKQQREREIDCYDRFKYWR